MFENLALWFESHQQTCIFKNYWGFECPGCGFQTSLIALLRGQWTESFLIYPMLIPILLTILLFFCTIFIPKNKNISWLLKIMKYDAVLLVVQYFWKVFILS